MKTILTILSLLIIHTVNSSSCTNIKGYDNSTIQFCKSVKNNFLFSKDKFYIANKKEKHVEISCDVETDRLIDSNKKK